ncbi:uncharacterized protein LOC6562849 [Drosophila grimshawi]|uniref:GH10640 n=1 Tax=Drosophila grimshawi TaxID=7222 RepID=B4JCS9_DROGR|nr:uncharacterized protein LOC6562849 [Drosophila grimshawi]EDW03168.1 GH10640 [Drosophila grimshawi]
MSKRKVATGTSRREYAAAEERLLDIFSPLSGAQEVTTSGADAMPNAVDAANAASPAAAMRGEFDVDPSRDNMMHFISDDLEIRSLLASSNSSPFNGFCDDMVDYPDEGKTVQQSLVFGTAPKRASALLSPLSNAGSPLDMPEADAGTSAGYMQHITNGNLNGRQSELEPSHEQQKQQQQQQLVMDCQNVIVEEHAECVIYDDEDDNVVLLNDDDHCCEIIVAAHGGHPEQEIERSYLLGLQHVPSNEQEPLNNGVNYGSEQELEHSGEPHVYLSDAALDHQQHHYYQQQQQHHHQHHHQQLEEEQLQLDASDEDQVCDAFVDEQPDICDVYEHELEDNDQDDQDSSLQLELQPEQQVAMVQLEISSEEHQQQDEEEEQAAVAATAAAVPHSSTTEFPVSSTSLTNGSDYDDYDDDQGTAEEQSPPVLRKYIPLLKNTLSAEAMDRRLASICQSQPQMTLSEKLASWNCSTVCEAVEDVENFDAVFAAQEAEPAKRPKFNEFHEFLRQSSIKSKQELNERTRGDTMDTAIAPDTPYSSEDAAMQKRPNYRRLLPIIPPAELVEPIVLDDDEDEDDNDCYEVVVNPSTMTLVPERKQQQQQPNVKTMQTQTLLPLPRETKETSTTDLVNQSTPSVPMDCLGQVEVPHQQIGESQELHATAAQTHLQLQQQHEEQHQPPVHSNDAQFYEQHEFCNYLGLTELATANAVATAMRELANSNLARRSLRVRTQQQLDRMRSDVRGKRRGGKQREQLQQQQLQQLQQPEAIGQELNSDTSSISSNASRSKKSTTALDAFSVEPQSGNFVFPMFATMGTVSDTSKYYCSAQGDVMQLHEQQQQESHFHAHSQLPASDFHTMSLEAAFAKVYAAAAPTQSDLYESIQNRLRQARERKPDIYIVKATNNAMPTSPKPPSTVKAPHIAPDRRSPQYNNNNDKPEQAAPPDKGNRKTHKKMVAKTSKRRRAPSKTTGRPERDLVTRSTTHMNSKLLRNRKVNLLQSYQLSDARGKQRLSGGTQPTLKRRSTPKVDKRSAKKAKMLHEQIVISQATSLPKLHKLKSSKQLSPSVQKQPPVQVQPKANTKRMRLRTNSLPTALVVGDCDVVRATPELSPKKPQTKLFMDPQEFLTLKGVVSPPHYSAAVRRYVNAVCKPSELISGGEQQEQLQQQLSQQRQAKPQQQENQSPEISFNAVATPTLIQYPPLSPPPSQRAPHFSRRTRQLAGFTPRRDEPIEPNVPLRPSGGLLSLSQGSTALRNPLAGKNGKVLYMYYELDQLIVLQEKFISFWKYSNLFGVLRKETPEASRAAATQHNAYNIFNTPNPNQNTRKTSTDSDKSDGIDAPRWIYLGGTRRVTNDVEVPTPHSNRLCTHNATPVYIEMRSHLLEQLKRESKLLSLYVNVYYYCEEELRPKMHSVHLDAVNCDWNEVIYTSIRDSRYFVMAHQQEMVLGKPRTGMCKYSLTPTLDTLASIREFKPMRHVLRHIECLTEDRLIGYGQTRITIWDHRSGDMLMNYDFGFELGHNLGAMHFPSFDMEQSSMLVLYQHIKEPNNWPELRIIACELSHATPSHRLLHVHHLPSPQFDCQLMTFNTGDHLILIAPTDDEVWISTSDPRQLTYVAPQGTQRFYTRQKSQIITMTQTTLAVDSIANHVLKLSTEHQDKMMMAASSSPQLAVST